MENNTFESIIRSSNIMKEKSLEKEQYHLFDKLIRPKDTLD